MPEKTQKIYYFSYENGPPEDRTPLKMTVIFGIPFFCYESEDPDKHGTWVPFLGIQTKKANDIPISTLRRPSLMEGTNVDDIFASLKCVLISAIIGGGYWDSIDGLERLAFLEDKYGRAFENYAFKMADSGKKFYQQSGSLKYHEEVNNFLSQNSVKNFADFSFDDWLLLQDLSVLAKPGNKPLSLVFEQPKITDFFPKVFPTYAGKLNPSKLPLYYPDRFCSPEIQKKIDRNFIAFVSQRYDSVINFYSNHTEEYIVKNGICVTADFSNMSIRFLSNGHIIVFDEATPQLAKTANVSIFKAYAVTMGKMVMVKVSSLFDRMAYPSVSAAAKHSGVMDILGLSFYKQANSYDMTIIMPVYNCDLDQVLKKIKLNTSVKEKMFGKMLAGLSKIHMTPIHFNNVKNKLYHGDVKPQNVFLMFKNGKTIDNILSQGLKAEDFNLVFADLDSAGRFDSCFYTMGYLSPDVAGFLLDKGINYIDDNHYNFCDLNIEFAKPLDVWALGVSLARVLSQKDFGLNVILNTLSYNYSDLYHANISPQKHNMKTEEYLLLQKTKNISQNEIDAEISNIIHFLPRTVDGNRLRAMWKIVNSMLQVNPKQRPTIFDLCKTFNAEVSKMSHPKFKQSLITDYKKFIQPLVTEDKKPKNLFERAKNFFNNICSRVVEFVSFVMAYFTNKQNTPVQAQSAKVLPVKVNIKSQQNKKSESELIKQRDLFWLKSGFKPIEPKANHSVNRASSSLGID